MHRSMDEVLASQNMMLKRRAQSKGGTSDADMTGVFAQHLKKVEALIDRRPNCDVLYIDCREALDSPTEVAKLVDKFLS